MKIKYHDSTNVIVDVLPIDGDSLVYFREHAKYDFNDVSQLVLVFKAKIDIDGSFVGYNKVVTACSIDDRSYVEGKICRDSINIKMYAYQSNPSLDDSNSRNIVRYEGVLIK